MNFKIKQHSLLIASMCLVGSVQAADVKWGGFGTIGVGMTLNGDNVSYNANPILVEPDGVLTDEYSFKPLSLFALQADVKFNNKMSATVQLKSIGADNWDPTIAWAYVTYNVNSNVKVQAGRKLLPIYSYTDLIDVGNTYHWIRPPADVYSVAAIRYDGVNALYQDYFGDFEISTNALIGRIEDDETMFGDEGPIDYKVWGGNIEALYDDWISLRFAGFSYTDFHFKGDLGGGLEAPPFDVEYYGLAFSMMPGNWNLISEYTWYSVDSDELFGEGTGTKLNNDLEAAWYVSAAYSMGDWTPHLTYSHREFKDQGPTVGLIAFDESTIIAGVRYNLHASSSLKLEFHKRLDDSTRAGSPAPKNGKDDIDVVMLAIDFMF